MRIIARYAVIFVLLFLIALTPLQSIASEDSEVVMEYFYGDECPACNETKPLIDNIGQYYGNEITLQLYSVVNDPETENYQRWRDYYGFQHYPSVVIMDPSNGYYTLFQYEDLSDDGAEENLKHTIDGYLAGNYSGIQVNQNQSTINDISSSLDIFLVIVLLAAIVVAAIIFIIWKRIA